MRDTSNKKTAEIRNTVKDLTMLKSEVQNIINNSETMSAFINQTPVNEANAEYLSALKIEIAESRAEMNEIVTTLEPISKVLLSPNVTRDECRANQFPLIGVAASFADASARYQRALLNYNHILEL